MTQEDKQLLLVDLCGRLPYGVIVNVKGFDYDYNDKLTQIYKGVGCSIQVTTNMPYDIEQVKPYLFPLSSMTEEQRQEFLSLAGYERREEDCGRHTETYYYDMVGHEHNFYPNSDAIDWLNANHFDYRGLIEKGLAIDATDKNIY